MRRILTSLLLVTLMLSIPAAITAQAAMPERGVPVVNGILFWSNGCPHCETVLLYTLPPLQEAYRHQLNIQMVELVTLEDVDEFFAIFTAFGLSTEQIDVPLLLINDAPLVGSEQIAAELPDLIEQYLAVGGIEPPLILGEHAALLARAVPFTSFDPDSLIQAEEKTGFNGDWLGWVVMALMGIAVALVILAMLRAFQGKPMESFKGWLDMAVPILSIVGLGVALYLTYVEWSHARAICGPVGDCNTVQSSSYARLFGFFPVGLLGALGYIAMLVAWGCQHWRTDRLAKLSHPALFGMALFGLIFSIYLTYLEMFVIMAVCIWCLSSAVIMALLVLLTLPAATQWVAVSDEEEE
jgi:uncharacterized membrane protein